MRLRNVKGSREAIQESFYVVHEEETRAGSWHDIFGNDHPIHIEIGMGKGRFLMELAAKNPDINYVGIEKYSSVLIRALEKMSEMETPLVNIRFVRMDAEAITKVFGAGEVDRIYLNFSDPWPKDRHAKRRLTSDRFLPIYDQILKKDGIIEFKTDNQDLFSFSIEELPLFGFELSEVTRDLHADGPVGVMTDYEAKFYGQGLPICRCVGTMVPWEEPFPTDIRRVKNRWLDVFAEGVSEAELGKHVLSEGNYLWHLFSWNLVPCLSGDAARQALSEASGEKYLFYYEEPPEGEPLVRPVTAEELVTLPADARAIPGADWYVVDKDFTWTFAQPHEADCGPYFCQKA